MSEISDTRAIELATQAIEGKAVRQAGSRIEVTRAEGRVTVVFVHITPPDELGADYDAKVTLDATTGDVVQILGAP
jgi:hypothetical protein